ncbi:hypothetical protein HBH1_01267 [Herbaspirillum sp. BH-1]|uniref:HEPN AbiU2-like domain-containing protein n=1 Tax=Herbaspirillum frisingense TaxID=92645 RepID=A0ABU1PCB0_9BURK|nr:MULTISPECIES: hypothetical protein [Herbaspirillum]MDR6582798.1 hypothetical protein [Herbaspirillum frisingense]PLY60619.1 hypothetical protein HBH1_01267 [Herbaspirillum sp. BH-1]
MGIFPSSVNPGRVSEDVEVEALRTAVRAAQDEILMAVAFYETWRPTIENADLANQLGTSFATNAFNVIQFSLQRELLLALVRIWDTNKKSLRMTAIREKLKRADIVERIVQDRKRAMGMRADVSGPLRAAIGPKCAHAVTLISKYIDGGARFRKLQKLVDIRHLRLAHRQLASPENGMPEVVRAEIDEIYLETIEIVQTLLSAVNAVSFPMGEAAEASRHYAEMFWQGVRGERTQGHPAFKSPCRNGLD